MVIFHSYLNVYQRVMDFQRFPSPVEVPEKFLASETGHQALVGMDAERGCVARVSARAKSHEVCQARGGVAVIWDFYGKMSLSENRVYSQL